MFTLLDYPDFTSKITLFPGLVTRFYEYCVMEERVFNRVSPISLLLKELPSSHEVPFDLPTCQLRVPH